ncbi:SigE family RNA polymerase sigma factor [Streptomyces sp. CB01881]|uniref:SigE family RNA polymerase sigma factor n=1 Tax=Streptomyces sp. CB01881 TaxID=2078691 RepID=UPI000CDC8E20|nr:SigE family RNA polymerase sigma factor [Streptomyces sp. CB01881]AUY49388.1 SigE family RNA polymerase sigma factor [Streptomyces sp. CB01881]TYC72777.1 SigE family RNA polymerase sigma factor [Streptomyces sp. CB01881]
MADTPADFLEFAHARSDQLFRTACLLTGDRHLAEDLVQETLAKMYRSWWRIDRTQAPVAYAHTVLVRTFTSYRRRLSAQERPVDRFPEGAAAEAGDADLRLTLLDGLARLTPKDRAVLVLRYWEDRPVEETARMLQISAGAVRTRSLRALQKLRTVLGDDLLADLEHI